jgi:hypothetical protein
MAISGILVTSNKRRGVTAERLAKNWNILIERARKTIEATTQECMIRAPAGTKLKPMIGCSAIGDLTRTCSQTLIKFIRDCQGISVDRTGNER